MTTSTQRMIALNLVIVKIYVPSNKYRREKLIKIQRFWRRASGFEAAPIYRSSKNLGLYPPELYRQWKCLHTPGDCPHASIRRRFKWFMGEYLLSHLYKTATKKQLNFLKKSHFSKRYCNPIEICCCNGPDMRNILFWWYGKEIHNSNHPFFLTSRKRIYELLARDTITPQTRMKASIFIQNKLAPK